MPKYNFQCNSCDSLSQFEMKVTKFLNFKKETHGCQACSEGILIQIVRPSHGKIIKDKATMIQDARDEARKVVEKIESGDQKAFNDIYGDKANAHKTK